MNLNVQQVPQQQAAQQASTGVQNVVAVEVNDRYADSIIGGCAHLYDAIEIHGVRDHYAGTGRDETHFEIDERNPQMYSVYVHIASGDTTETNIVAKSGPEGVDVVGDFSTYDLALEYAQELGANHGWPVHDFVVNKVPNSLQ